MAKEITEQENIKVTGLLWRARADEAYPIVLVFILAPESSDVRVRAGGGDARIGDGSAFIDYAEIKFQITAQPVGQENEYCAVFKTEELPKSFRRRANLEDVSSREMIMRFDSNTSRSVFQAIARLENYRLVIAAKERLEQIQKQNSLEIPEAEAIAAVALTYDFGFNCPDAVLLVFPENTSFRAGAEAWRQGRDSIRLTDLIKNHVRPEELREIAGATSAETIPASVYSSGGWRFNRAGLSRLARIAIERERACRARLQEQSRRIIS